MDAVKRERCSQGSQGSQVRKSMFGEKCVCVCSRACGVYSDVEFGHMDF